MKRNIKYSIVLFFIIGVLQWIVPMQMVFKSENILKKGTAYKFKTRPIDPTDPLRGKYITLNYELDYIKTADSSFVWNQEAYLEIENDTLGYVKGKTISHQPFTGNKDYIRVKVKRYNKGSQKLYFDMINDRFYMDENKAYDAELAYRKVTRDSLKTAYALIYVYNGEGIIDQVILDGVPIEDYVE
ncbi:GDYXXLXY domain-containing protein [Aquimarina rhabdastrellae]